MKYLNKLEDKRLIEFLNKNGLFILDNLSEASDIDDAEYLHLRCMSSDPIESESYQSFKSFFASKFPAISGNFQSYDNNNIHIFSLNDYIIQRLFVLDELTEFDYKLQKNYHEFMMAEFAANGEYENDYNNYVDELSSDM